MIDFWLKRKTNKADSSICLKHASNVSYTIYNHNKLMIKKAGFKKEAFLDSL